MTQIGTLSARQEIVLPASRGVLTLAWAAATDRGHRRELNEDSLIVVPPIFAVADGMGGHSSGDVASKTAVESLATLPADLPTTVEAITLALQEANETIRDASEGLERGMGTTVSGVAVVEDAGQALFAILNIGDSRVYLSESGELSRVTVDHSVVQAMVAAGMISEAEAEEHPNSNVITRALGFEVDAVPDVWLLPARVGQRLLVCSDGLTRELGDEWLRLNLGGGFPPEATAHSLVESALAAGGRDNVTVIVLDVLDVRSGDD